MCSSSHRLALSRHVGKCCTLRANLPKNRFSTPKNDPCPYQQHLSPHKTITHKTKKKNHIFFQHSICIFLVQRGKGGGSRTMHNAPNAPAHTIREKRNANESPEPEVTNQILLLLFFLSFFFCIFVPIFFLTRGGYTVPFVQ